MKTLGKVLGTILIVGIFTLLGGFASGTFGAEPYTFIGDKTFADLAEMQKFQQEVVTAVKEAGGTVQSFDLRVQSPPKVHFILFVPKTRHFQYGDPAMNYVTANTLAVAFAIASVLFGGVLSYKVFWAKSYFTS